MNPLTFISPGLQVYARIAAVFVVAFACASAGWMLRGWKDGTEIANLKAQHAPAIADAAGRSQAAQKKADADHAELASRLSDSESRYHEDLTRSLHENDSLRTAVATGARVVRVAGTCPGRPGDVPQAAAGGQLDPRAGAVLDAAGGQAVLDLRAGAIRADRKLAACQAAVKCLTGQGACPAPDSPSSN